MFSSISFQNKKVKIIHREGLKGRECFIQSSKWKNLDKEKEPQQSIQTKERVYLNAWKSAGAAYFRELYC